MKSACQRRTAALLCCCMLGAALPAQAAQGEAQPPAQTVETELAEDVYTENEFLAKHMQTLYSDENGMAVDETNDICQTADGYLWIASYNGLTRFDGQTFETYNTDSQPALQATGIIRLFLDSKNRLWIGSNDNGLFRLEDGAFVKLEAQGLGLSVRAVVEGTEGRIYAATSGGVGRVEDDGTLAPLSVPELAGASAADLAVDRLGQLWVLLTSGELVVLREDTVAARFQRPAEQIGAYTTLFADPNGLIWAGTELGEAMRFEVRGTAITPLAPVLLEGLSQINSFYRDGERLWACADNGVGYLDDALKFTLLRGCLLTNSLERMLRDYEGSYWIASSRQGMLKLSQSKFFNLGVAVELPAAVVNSTQTAWGDLHLATDQGLTVLGTDGKTKTTPLTELLSGVRLRQLYLDSKDRLWISTYQSPYGLICAQQDGTYTAYNEETAGLGANTVRSVLERANGQMVVATGRGVDVLEDGAVVQHYGMSEGLFNPVILSMCEDAAGLLYAGSDGNGIYVIDTAAQSVRHVSQSEGLTTGVILRMALDPRGRGLWISTGNQVDYYDFATKQCGPVKRLAPSKSNIFDLKFLPDGRLLMLSAKGMTVADVATYTGLGDAGGALPTAYYDKNAGLSATITANSWSCLTEEGELFLCLNPGIDVIRAGEVASNTHAPKVAISKVIVDDVPYLGSRVTIPADATRISIAFSALSYVDQSRLEVTYQMEGFDVEPVTVLWAEQSLVSYTNLSGGTYVFRVSAQTGDGVESETPAFVTIDKDKRLREAPGFLICSIIFGALILWLLTLLYLRSKTKKIQQRQQEYRDITEQSLRTIANTIDAKDSNTNGHSLRVARFARELARRMQLSEQAQDYVYYCALLHDIGKIGIPDAILHKPGALTDEELEIMRSHATIGGEILKEFHAIPDIHIIVSSHHENYGGGGYPSGAEGDDTPLFAQIIRVADAYDAMASHRSYRASMSETYILSELEKYSGTHFNPLIAEHMENLIREGFTTAEAP